MLFKRLTQKKQRRNEMQIIDNRPKIISLHIMYGLPGSGKTHLAYQMQGKSQNSQNFIQIINLDILAKLANNNWKTIGENAVEKTGFWKYIEELAIDGLFLNTKDLEDFLESFLEALENMNQSKDFDFRPIMIKDVTIHAFQEDRETCLYNDLGRREVHSAITIQNAPYEMPNRLELQTKFPNLPIQIKEYEVVRKKETKTLKDKVYEQNEFDLKICSERWSTGGTVCDCYGGHYNVREEEPLEPEDFSELNEILYRIYPNMSEKDYNWIWNTVVSEIEDSDSDYYGGVEYFSYFEVELEELFQALKERMGYNPEDFLTEKKEMEMMELEERDER